METHFPGSRSTDKGWRNEHKKQIRDGRPRLIPRIFFKVVTVRKIRAAFRKFGDKKAAGVDQIKPVVLKHLPNSTIKRLAGLYRASLALGYMPTDWLISKTIFIPKPGKENYKLAKSFRPISLSSFILKGLERVVSWYMEETVLVEKPLSRWQHGFRKDKSTTSAISQVVNYIEGAKCQGEYCVAILLDIQGAFDNVNAQKAKEALLKHGFPKWFVIWYGSFLEKRYANTELNGEEIISVLTRGTPQGDVISTIAWDVVYDPLLIDINLLTTCLNIGFADDGNILKRGRFLADIFKECQKALDIAVQWGIDNGLAFNASKTEVLIFTDKRRPKSVPKLMMNGVELQISKEAKYLGITLDEGLNWKSHMTQKVKMAKKKLMMMKSVISSFCGPSNKLIEWAYKGIVIPAMAYGATAWYKRLEMKINNQMLRQVNRLAMLLLTKGVHRSTPTRTMEILMNYPPLDLVLRKEALMGATRMRQNKTYWDGIGTGKKRSTIFLQAKELGKLWDMSLHKETTHRKINYNTSSHMDTWTVDRFEVSAVLYTTKTKISWNAFYVIKYRSRKLSYENENFSLDMKEYQVQMLMLQRLIESFEQANLKCDNMVILAKGNAIEAVNMKETRYRLIQEVWNIMQKCKTHICFRVNRSNHCIDIFHKYAKTALPYKPDYPCFTEKSIKNELHDRMMKTWNQEWKAYPEAQQSKLWLEEVNIPSGLKDHKRHIIGIIIQIITGHGPFLYHLQKIDEEIQDSTCQLCFEEEQTASHLILQCPALQEERATYRIENPKNSGQCIDTILDSLRAFTFNVKSLNELFELSRSE